MAHETRNPCRARRGVRAAARERAGRGGSQKLTEEARAACVAAGHPAEKLQFTRYEYRGGRFGFVMQGEVDFRVKDADPPQLLRVAMYKPVDLLGWRLTGIEEVPLQGKDKRE
jgi:hypothetical protein